MQFSTTQLPAALIRLLILRVTNAPKIHVVTRGKSHSGLPDTVGQQKEASAQTESRCTESEYLNWSQGKDKASLLYYYQISGKDSNL